MKDCLAFAICVSIVGPVWGAQRVPIELQPVVQSNQTNESLMQQIQVLQKKTQDQEEMIKQLKQQFLDEAQRSKILSSENERLKFAMGMKESYFLDVVSDKDFFQVNEQLIQEYHQEIERLKQLQEANVQLEKDLSESIKALFEATRNCQRTTEQFERTKLLYQVKQEVNQKKLDELSEAAYKKVKDEDNRKQQLNAANYKLEQLQKKVKCLEEEKCKYITQINKVDYALFYVFQVKTIDEAGEKFRKLENEMIKFVQQVEELNNQIEEYRKVIKEITIENETLKTRQRELDPLNYF